MAVHGKGRAISQLLHNSGQVERLQSFVAAFGIGASQGEHVFKQNRALAVSSTMSSKA